MWFKTSTSSVVNLDKVVEFSKTEDSEIAFIYEGAAEPNYICYDSDAERDPDYDRLVSVLKV